MAGIMKEEIKRFRTANRSQISVSKAVPSSVTDKEKRQVLE